MLLYWGKRVDAEQGGGRVVRVECSKCGCEYFYELTRIGTGSRSVPYGIGVDHATDVARGQSKRDLAKRLATEAELVPCPKCNWINDDLIQGFRCGRYRSFGSLAVGIGVVGTALSLIAAWIISVGPGADRVAVPYCLFGGPILFNSLAIAVILFRSWMRSRIQPNRDFPLAPKLPPGSPPALLRDESSGELRQVKQDSCQDSTTRGWHDFQFGRDRLPPMCCVCLKEATIGYAYKRPITTTFNLEIPRCAGCAWDAKRNGRRIWCNTFVVSFLIGVATGMLLRLELAEFCMLIACSALISAAFAAFIASTVTAPVKIGVVDPARSVIRLQFRNAEFARLIASDNDDSTPAA